MRRARLLIYDGEPEWIEMMKGKDIQSPFKCAKGVIHSIELDADELTLFECADSFSLTGQGQLKEAS